MQLALRMMRKGSTTAAKFLNCMMECKPNREYMKSMNGVAITKAFTRKYEQNTGMVVGERRFCFRYFQCLDKTMGGLFVLLGLEILVKATHGHPALFDDILLEFSNMLLTILCTFDDPLHKEVMQWFEVVQSPHFMLFIAQKFISS